jgi:hypothetical protein
MQRPIVGTPRNARIVLLRFDMRNAIGAYEYDA